jgi:hypothetical protein
VEARFFAPVRTGPRAHPASCAMGTGFFPGVKSGRGVTMTSHHVYCRGHETVDLYLYSPYGPYDLYRDSVPVQGAIYFYSEYLNSSLILPFTFQVLLKLEKFCICSTPQCVLDRMMHLCRHLKARNEQTLVRRVLAKQSFLEINVLW